MVSNVERRIGGKITEARLGQGVTQAGLAEKLGLSTESISRMERGVSFPSLKTIERVAAELDVPLKQFFDFDDEPAKDNAYERELGKLNVFLRTLEMEELSNVHRILKTVFGMWKTKDSV